MDMNASNESYNSFPSLSSSSNETSLTCTDGSGSFSSELDQVVMLASENPKKRGGRKKFKETRHPVYRGVRSRVWRLPIPESNRVADIQKAAAQAAEAFRDTKPEVVMDYYMNEDELPGFLDSMAEALMLPPPLSTVGYGSNFFDDVESCADMSLWNF
ncbi:dehydration-responsive element-binding factor 1 [Artemisia annua]|uniref:Dehydration-responsive element-binding factor 1 n=1 Tax=Artemisia annua TaxID=35608 RepID=A0A2U1KDG3_ARTAN|nr:dehydration-responsive element-binding factor 1 [Artemisia annua]